MNAIDRMIERERIPPEIRDKEIKRFNENPQTKQFNVIAIKKGTYIGLWAFVVFVTVLLAIQVIWGNFILLKKDFSVSTNTTVYSNPNINVNPPIDVENEYEHKIYVNVTNIIPDNMTFLVMNITT